LDQHRVAQRGAVHVDEEDEVDELREPPAAAVHGQAAVGETAPLERSVQQTRARHVVDQTGQDDLDEGQAETRRSKRSGNGDHRSSSRRVEQVEDGGSDSSGPREGVEEVEDVELLSREYVREEAFLEARGVPPLGAFAVGHGRHFLVVFGEELADVFDVLGELLIRISASRLRLAVCSRGRLAWSCSSRSLG